MGISLTKMLNGEKKALGQPHANLLNSTYEFNFKIYKINFKTKVEDPYGTKPLKQGSLGGDEKQVAWHRGGGYFCCWALAILEFTSGKSAQQEADPRCPPFGGQGALSPSLLGVNVIKSRSQLHSQESICLNLFPLPT